MTRAALLLVVALPLITACPPRPAPSPVATPGNPRITTDELRAHVETLASDDYAGRETMEPGAERAAQHLAAQMRSYGLSPMPGQDGFVVKYELQRLGYVADKTTLTVGGTSFKAGADFSPFTFSDEGSAQADIVFAGYGITAPDLEWDDYDGIDVEGKLVLVLRHAPAEDDKDSKFRGTNHQLFATKAGNARKHGAVGMLLVTDPLHHADQPDDLRMRSALRLPSKQRRPSGRPPGDKTFLAAQISRSTANAIVSSSGKTLADIQRSLDDQSVTPAGVKLSGVNGALVITELPEPETVYAQNVMGFLAGADRHLRHEWIVVGAHFDHLGTYKGSGDTTYNGADDNASGTAGMLELAQAFGQRAVAPRRSIVFVGFSGEEKGLLGSRASLAQSFIPEDKVMFMLNLDMIGRNSERPLEVFGDGYGTGLQDITERSNGRLDLKLEFSGKQYAGNSDHHPFFERDIPVMFFFTGIHDDYHQLSDHADKLDYARMQKIVQLAYNVVERVGSTVTPPRFIHQIQWLGAEIQVKDDRDGKTQHAVITSIESDSRGKDAGLHEGDIIRGFGGDTLSDPTKVGHEFRKIQPGTKVSLVLHDRTVTIERAKTGFIGVNIGVVGDDERKELGLTDVEGIKIVGVLEDGPAQKAGMQEGDVLIRLAGTPVGFQNLSMRLARIGAGEKVDLVVVRAGKRVPLNLQLAERPAPSN